MIVVSWAVPVQNVKPRFFTPKPRDQATPKTPGTSHGLLKKKAQTLVAPSIWENDAVTVPLGNSILGPALGRKILRSIAAEGLLLSLKLLLASRGH